MKKIVLWGVLVVLSACNYTPKEGLLTLDVEKDYPEKELVLQDYWKVDYVKLETDSTYLLSSNTPWYASEGKVGFVDNKTGNILFFDAQTGGKLFCINRRGTGPEEYNGIGNLTMDEKSGEVFVWSIWEGVLMVYDAQGRFLRKLPLPFVQKGEVIDVMAMEVVDDSRLLCFSGVPVGEKYALCYYMDKQTGEKVLVDSIAGEEFVSPILMEEVDGVIRAVAPNLTPVVKSADGFVYANHSRDTIYRIPLAGDRTPLLVRTPSVMETKPHILLRYENETHEWIFLSAIELAFDFRREEGLRQTSYGIQKLDGQIYKMKYVNADYEDGSVSMANPNGTYWGADELLNALYKGKLKGRLKELAEQLDADDNGILMRLH